MIRQDFSGSNNNTALLAVSSTPDRGYLFAFFAAARVPCLEALFLGEPLVAAGHKLKLRQSPQCGATGMQIC